MAKGRTGFEIIKSWLSGQKVVPVEEQYYNPLAIKVGAHARLNNTYGLDQDLWDVTEIWAWVRRLCDHDHPMTDYMLESDDKRIVLRLLPKVSRGKSDEPEVLLLQQYYPETPGPLPWGEESPHVLDALMDDSGQFVRFKGEVQEECYFRDLCNVSCAVTILKDGDGSVSKEEADYSLWTFRRDTTDEADQTFTQYLHVQLSGKDQPRLDDGYKLKTVEGGDKDLLILRGELFSSLNLMMY
jgi:hypothetical protein